MEGGYAAGMELLSLSLPPTAILASNNKMLLGLMRAIGERGVACPGGVSVAGFDDYVWTENFTPALTTVAQPTYEMGQTAMRMLLSKMRGQGELNEIVQLRAELR